MSHTEHSEPSLPSWLVVAFSGHRALENPTKVKEAIQDALNKLASRNHPLAGISSAASGGDTLFAEEMSHRGHPITIVLPFPCDRFAKDFEGDPDGWQRSQDLMRKAIEVDIVHQSALDKLQLQQCDESVPVDEKAKDLDPVAYMEAAYRTIDRADVLLAVWNEKEGRGFGGTADAVRYAIAIGLPLIILNPDTGQVTEERLEKLPPPLLQQIEPIKASKQVVESYFKAVDHLASKHAPWARQLIRWCLRLHLIAAMLGAAALVFREDFSVHTPIILGAAELLVLGLAFEMLRRRGPNYELWLKHRGTSEVCRSFLATWQIRRHAVVAHQPRPALPGLKDLFTNLRLLRQLDDSPKLSFEQARSDYETNRIANQLKYFHKKRQRSLIEYNQRKLVMKLCTGGAVLCSLGLVICRYVKPTHWVTEMFEFFAIGLPLVTTALGILLITDESSRRVIRYKEMITALEYFEIRIKACRTWDSLACLATNVEEELLQEILEWQSFVRHTEHLH